MSWRKPFKIGPQQSSTKACFDENKQRNAYFTGKLSGHSDLPERVLEWFFQSSARYRRYQTKTIFQQMASIRGTLPKGLLPCRLHTEHISNFQGCSSIDQAIRWVVLSLKKLEECWTRSETKSILLFYINITNCPPYHILCFWCVAFFEFAKWLWGTYYACQIHVCCKYWQNDNQSCIVKYTTGSVSPKR